MNVIKFPVPERSPSTTERQELRDTLGIAFAVHRMIFNIMRMECFCESPDALGSKLLLAMSQYFGPDLVHWAQLKFEDVYGIDPLGFIARIVPEIPKNALGQPV
jgi:hypothetical protein